MKKSHRTIKDIAKDRVAKNKLVELPRSERIFAEETKLVLPRIKKYPFRKFDREVESEKPENPFKIQKRDKVFNYGKCSRKPFKQPHIITDLKTVTADIHPLFYKVIEGRPLRQLDDFKRHVRSMRDITLLRANAAYFNDQILQIDAAYHYEQKQFADTYELYKKTKENFYAFARQSYTSAQLVQTQAKEMDNLVDKVSIELDNLSTKYIKLRNEISALSYSLDLSFKYRNFLTDIAPIPWRIKNNLLNIDECINFTKIFDEAEMPFSKKTSFDLYKSSVAMLQNLSFEMYFKVPQDLMDIFEEIRTQCLNYIQISIVSSSILEPVTLYKDYLLSQEAFDSDVNIYIEHFEKHINYMKEKEKNIKVKFFHLINTEFYNLYASFDNTKLFTCVQYVNNFVLKAHEDPKDNILTLMRQIESLYLRLSIRLDDLDQVIVKKAEKEFFSEDIKIMKRAHLAQRIIKECDILRKAIYTSFEPPRYKNINSKL